MLYRGKQDMFDERPDVMVNPVNCSGIISNKTAQAFKRRFPEMLKEYQRRCTKGDIKAGELHFWHGADGQVIVNFPVKDRWSDGVFEETVESGLGALREFLRGAGKIKVTIPALGCEAEAGGLKWDRVKTLLKKHLGDLDATILVYPPDGTDVQASALGTSAGDEGYITFCKAAVDVQQIWVPRMGDNVFHSKFDEGVVFVPGAENGLDHIVVKFRDAKSNVSCNRLSLTFMPRTEQLQEMISSQISAACGLDFCNFPLVHVRQSKDWLPYFKSFSSSMALWLALVMDVRFSKVWSSAEQAWIAR